MVLKINEGDERAVLQLYDKYKPQFILLIGLQKTILVLKLIKLSLPSKRVLSCSSKTNYEIRRVKITHFILPINFRFFSIT